MARTTIIGNGNLLVGIDERGFVRDFYYPYVGVANHVSGASGSYKHRLGVWVNGTLAWLDDPAWTIDVERDPCGAVDAMTAQHAALGVSLRLLDVVHNEHDVFFRKITLKNLGGRRTVKVFFGQEFRISESRRGDTAFYDPRVGSIIHYKGHDAFLVHARIDGRPFDDYGVGLFGIENREGTYADAEDGVLSRNAIEHGSTDSVIGVAADLEGNAEATVHYWITAGDSIHAVHLLHDLVLEESPERLISSAINYWRAWVGKEGRDLKPVDDRLAYLYRRSLMVMRMHADNRGGIIASSDTDVLNQGRDTYGYVWPRDAAMTVEALDRAGYHDLSARLFSFFARVMEKDGYLMHKYIVDGSLGSSWHPWVRNGATELPIQEDETATPIFMLARHYERAKDLEFIESLYNPFIEPAADFMCGYVDEETGLPAGSYDLWEEKFGMSTYTAASVYGALMGAADLSALLGKRENVEKYRARALHVKQAILTYLYDVSSGAFVKLARREGGNLTYDKTIDVSSLHGLLYFGVLSPHDPKVKSMVKHVEERLKVPTPFGGYMRFENDNYYRTGKDAPPNAWCITTLWMAGYEMRVAKTRADLMKAYGMLEWVYDRATKTGILPEQIDPHTGAHLSTSPLVWSQAEFVTAVDEYVRRFRALS
ncbi:MAG TPA: glycoside hydrolase family 15 protein [Candidatus Paceibacterota bacterium]|nr:glycoside hydrolase family 15 protein [Candidatus Paceibacterota bacterium]